MSANLIVYTILIFNDIFYLFIYFVQIVLRFKKKNLN